MHKLRATLILICVIAALTLCLHADDSRSARSVFYSFFTDEKVIALTFDDGPHKYRTNEILDILSENDVKATFFVVGVMAEEYPDVIRRTLAEGHEIGNHTYNHSKMKKLSAEKLKYELERTEEVLFEICEYRPKLFRPPEGWCSDSIASAAGELDYDVILWNIDTLDWAHNEVGKICECVSTGIRPGSIILFHDYVSGDSSTVDALKLLIPELKADGYRFVTVSELINMHRGMT
ncbi:MAG: polysaccharide deacetylase family protein [Clostridia bacterium]|nr:polysaccharide deacetylase family protein [Clostridia bacterium]